MASGLQDVISWAATARMAGNAWARGSIPTAYAKQTLQQASEQLRADVQALSALQLAQTPIAGGAPLKQHLERLQAVAQQMVAALDKGDRASMAEQVKRLATEEEAVKAVSAGAGQ